MGNWQIGDKIENRWEIHKILRGGMGIVYVVYDHELRETFAAKTFQDEIFASNPQIGDRFIQEALAWVKLDIHQNLTQAHAVQNIKGKPFVFLEYVGAGDLNGWIGTENLLQALRFSIQFCDGMIHALSKGIHAHRDIKPQNCLVTEDRILKVTDFGLAKVFDDARTMAGENGGEKGREKGDGGFWGKLLGRWREADTPTEPPRAKCHRLKVGLTRTGTAAGTPTHMAPEQFDDMKHVDLRADIYSFGVMLFQMLEGRLPFLARTWQEFERLHKTQPPPPLTAHDSTLANVVHTCLAKDPAHRFAHFEIVRKQLAEIYLDLSGELAPQAVCGLDLDAVQLKDKGWSLCNLGRYDEALACYERALELNPRYAEVWVNKGLVLGASLGRHGDALACYDRAIALNPRLELAWNNKGLTLRSLARDKEALVSYDRALQLNPRLALALKNKGVLLQKLGRHDEALACYEQAVEVEPRDEKAWYARGLALIAVGRYDEALSCLDRAVKIRPDFGEAYFNKGVTFEKLGLMEKALACYNRTIELVPGNEQAWVNKGVILRVLGDTTGAIACYDHALIINPTSKKCWNNKGVALGALRRWQQAFACYERAINLDPDYQNAWLNRGAALADGLGNWREAIACYDRALALNSECPKAWSNKGIALRQIGCVDDALACFQVAQRLGHPNVAEDIEDCRRMLGKGR